MQATVAQQRAFRFLEGGESVLWASVPVLHEAVDAVCQLSPQQAAEMPVQAALTVPEWAYGWCGGG